MRKETVKGEIASAYGKLLHLLERREVVDGKPKADGAEQEKFPVGTVLKYSGAYDAFENRGEIEKAGKWPNEAAIVDFVNVKEKANAKQKLMQIEQDLAGLIRPTLENDVTLQLKTIYAGLMASKRFTEDAAKALAATNLGLDEWPSDLKV